MNIVAKSIEMRVLKTICRNNEKITAHLLGTLNEDFFQQSAVKAGFLRIKNIIKAKTEVMNWEELISDPVLDEDYRKTLAASKKPIYKTVTQAKKAIGILNKYRMLRVLYWDAKDRIKKLKDPSVDFEAIMQQGSDAITRAKTSTNKEHLFTHIGRGNNSSAIFKRVLNGLTARYIPTGFKVFDSVNQGFRVGSLVILAAVTSGGKSTLAQQIQHNMATWGASVCYVPLEMDEEEMAQRHVANIAKVSMSDIIAAKTNINKAMKIKIAKKLKEHIRMLKKKNAVESWYVPDTDVTIEEILFIMRPYAYDVIIIDYIGLLKGMDSEQQWKTMGGAARFAKIMAKNTDTLIILCAQLSADKLIRYSRALAEHANNLWAWTYDEKAQETHIIDVEQQKARQQKRFTFQLYADFEHMVIRDLDETERSWVEEQNANDNDAQGKTMIKGKGNFKGKEKKKSRFHSTREDDELLKA